MKRLISPALATFVAVTAIARPVAGATAAQRCASTKIRAAGKKTACLLSLDAKVAGGSPVDPTKVQKCKDKLADSFAGADRRGGCRASRGLGQRPRSGVRVNLTRLSFL